MNTKKFKINLCKYYNYKIGDKFIFGLIIILIMLVTFKVFGIDRDYENYVEIYDNLEGYPFLEFIPSILVKIGNYLNLSVVFFYLILASISIIGKFYIAKKILNKISLFLFIYLVYYFWIGEYTQIRYSTAIPFVILGLYFLGESLVLTLAFIFIGSLFHYSSLLMLFPIFLYKYGCGRTLIISLSIFLISFIFFQVSNIEIEDSTILNSVFEYINNKSGHIEYLNIINTFYLTHVLIVFAYIFLVNNSAKKVPLAIVSEYSAILGISSYMVAILMGFPVVAQRVLDFYTMPLLFAIPFVISFTRKKLLLICTFLVLYIYLFIYINFIFGIIPA